MKAGMPGRYPYHRHEPVTPYDVEAKRPGLTLLVAAVLIVGTVVLSVVFA